MSAHAALRSTSAAAVFALFLLAAAVPAAAASISLDSGEGSIDLDGEDVVIDAEGDEARITPGGDLVVDGRRVRTDERERRDLVRYNELVHSIVDRALTVGVEGAGLAISAIGEALAAVVTGDEARAERRVEARAEDLKDEARELCTDVRRLERIQDRLAEALPAFQPFAVMEIDADDCDVDD
jgi:hypothetical protein